MPNNSAISVPEDATKFKEWADRQCGKWPAELQTHAYYVWIDMKYGCSVPLVRERFTAALNEWSNLRC